MFSKIYNSALERVILPIGDRIEGGSFMSWLRMYRREQWLSSSKLEEIQRKRLAFMLEHARVNVPYYGAVEHSADPFGMLQRFPIVRKSDIREHVRRMTTQPIADLMAESSSGSSGVQGTVYMDPSAQASQRAMQMLWFEWSGYKMGQSIVQTGITPNRSFIKRSKDAFLRTDYVPAFDLSSDTISHVLKKATAKSRPVFLFGYASSLYVLAQAAIDTGKKVRFAFAVSWGDKLFPHYRRTIREAFGCETLDTYGCTEGAMIGAECREGAFHLSTNQCYVEIVDDDGRPVPAGVMGKVLVTRLDNFAMPLIRYYLGDLAEIDPSPTRICRCGRSSPLLRRVIGRDTDIVRTRSGKSMVVHFFTGIFEHVSEIRQFKVVQNDLDGIQIHYIPAPNFDRANLSRIERAVHDYLREPFPIIWIETDRIDATKSGKPQIIQSTIPQGVMKNEALSV